MCEKEGMKVRAKLRLKNKAVMSGVFYFAEQMSTGFLKNAN